MLRLWHACMTFIATNMENLVSVAVNEDGLGPCEGSVRIVTQVLAIEDEKAASRGRTGLLKYRTISHESLLTNLMFYSIE